MATIHISEAEAGRNLASLLSQARAGTEVIIDADPLPPVVLKCAAVPHTRLLSESLRLARQLPAVAILDESFTADLEHVLESHAESLNTPWE